MNRGDLLKIFHSVKMERLFPIRLWKMYRMVIPLKSVAMQKMGISLPTHKVATIIIPDKKNPDQTGLDDERNRTSLLGC